MHEPILINPTPNIHKGKRRTYTPKPNQIIYCGVGRGGCEEILFGIDIPEELKKIANKSLKNKSV